MEALFLLLRDVWDLLVVLGFPLVANIFGDIHCGPSTIEVYVGVVGIYKFSSVVLSDDGIAMCVVVSVV